MPSGFSISANLIVRGPANISAVASSIQKQLSGVNATVNVQLPKGVSSQLSSLNSQIKSLNSSLTAIGSNRGAVSGLSKVSQGTKSVTKDIEQAKTAAYEFGLSIGTAARKFTAFSLAAGAIISFTSAIKEGISSALEFQNQMVRLNQIGGNTANSIGEISKEISSLSTSLGTSSAGLSKVAITLRQAGLSADDTRVALRGIAETTLAPTFDDVNDTVEASIAGMKQFSIQAKDLRGVLGSINRVSADFATESSDLTHVIVRSGGAFKNAGGNLNELLALFTSVRQTTRESAETIASGFNTIFARVQRPQTVEQLKLMGINLRYTADEARAFGKTSGEFVGPYEAVRRLNQALQDVPTASAEYAAIVEAIGGFRQVSKVIPLIQQFGTAQKVYASSISGTQSLTQSSILAQESFIVKISKLKEEFLDLFRVLSGNKTLQGYANLFLTIATAVTKAAKAIEPLIPLLASLAIAKVAKTVGLGFNTEGIKGLKKGLTSNTGGYRFAGGGVVPGSGNTDSVPATLMPGEFVIRKAAAKAIGYNNLHKQNKYAAGGAVKKDDMDDWSWLDDIEDEQERKRIKQQYMLAHRVKKLPGGFNKATLPHFADGGKKKKDDDLEKIRLERDINVKNPDFNRLIIAPPSEKVPASDLASKKEIEVPVRGSRRVAMLVTATKVTGKKPYTQILPVDKLKGDAKERFDSDIKSLVSSGVFTQDQVDQIKGVTVPIAIRSPDSRKGSEVKDIIRNNISGTLNNLSKIFSESTAGITISPKDSDTILKESITEQGIGRIFEGFLKVVSTKVQGKNVSQGTSANFDFDPIDATGLSGLFPDVGGLTGDAKLNDNINSRISVVSKAIRKYGVDKNFALDKLSKVKKVYQSESVKDKKGKAIRYKSGKIKYQPKINKETGEREFIGFDPFEYAKRQISREKRAEGGRVRFATGGRADSSSIPLKLIEDSIFKFTKHRDNLQAGAERDKITDKIILLKRAAEASRQNRVTQLIQSRNLKNTPDFSAAQSFLLHEERQEFLGKKDAETILSTGSAENLDPEIKKLANTAQAPQNITKQLKKKNIFEKGPSIANILRIPFKGDRGLAIVGKGTIGQSGPAVNYRAIKDVGELSQNSTIINKLAESGIEKVETLYSRHILSKDATNDFSKTIYGPVANAIKSAFLGKFGDFAKKNISISKGTLDTLGGNLLEQYLAGVSQTLLAPNENGKESKFDFPNGFNPKSSINSVLLPKLNPTDRVDVKSEVASEKVAGSIAGKYLSFNASKIDQFLGSALKGKVKGTPKQLATGGPAGGDTVPALLTPGEFVFNREAAQRIGYNNLEKMNKAHLGGRIGFADGGQVPGGFKKFKYDAMDHTGKEFYGVVEAMDDNEANDILRRKGLFTTNLKDVTVSKLDKLKGKLENFLKNKNTKPKRTPDSSGNQPASKEPIYFPSSSGRSNKTFEQEYQPVLELTDNVNADRKSFKHSVNRQTVFTGLDRRARRKSSPGSNLPAEPDTLLNDPTIYGPQERIGIERRGYRPGSFRYNTAQGRAFAYGREGSSFTKERLDRVISNVGGGKPKFSAAEEALLKEPVRNEDLKRSSDPQARILQDILKAIRDGNRNSYSKVRKASETKPPADAPDVPANKEDSAGSKGKLGKLFEGLKNNKLTTAALVLGSQYLPQLAESTFGTIERPGSGGVEGARLGATVAGAASGLFAGATTGALIGGTTGGPVGAAIGGLLGAVQGGLSAFNEANEKIRQIDFEKSSKKFDIAIERAANTVGKLNSTNISELGVGLAALTKGVDRSNDRKGFFAQNFNAEQSSRVQQRLISDIELTKDDTKDTRIQKFYEAGNGLGRQLARIRLEAENLSFEDLNKEIDEAVIRGASEAKREKVGVRLAALVDKQSRNFEALARATSSATAAISGMEGSLNNLIALSEGKSFTPDLPEFNGKLGGIDDKEFNKTVDFISNSFKGSGSDLVNQFSDTAKGINAASTVLPDALKQLLTRGVNENNIGEELVNIISTSGANVPKEISQNISEALGTFRLEESLAKIRDNSASFAEELERKAFPNIIQVLENAPKELRERFQKLGAGLAQFQELTNRTRDARNKAGDLSIESARVDQGIFARRSGLTGAANRVPVDLIQQEFNRRQTDLAGNIGLNPAAIGAELQRVKDAIPKAQEDRDRAVFTSPDSQETNNAQLALNNLTSRAADLNKALENLTNTSERGAAIQERLSQINEQESQRLSFAEEYLTSSIQDRIKIEKSLILARAAVQQGGLQRFNGEEAQQIFGVLRKLKDIRTPGLFGKTGDEAAQFLLKNDFRTGGPVGVANLPRGQEQEQRGLENDKSKIAKQAVEAQLQLAGSLETDRQKFFTSLFDIQTTFFKELNKLFLQTEKTRVQSQLTQGTVDLDKSAVAQRAGASLESVGLGDFGVARNVLSSPRIQSVVEGQEKIDRLQKFKNISPSDIFDDKTSTALDESVRGFNNKSINRRSLSANIAASLQDKVPGNFTLQELEQKIVGPAVLRANNNRSGLRLSSNDIKRELPVEINRAIGPILNKELASQRARVEEAKYSLPPEVDMNEIVKNLPEYRQRLAEIGDKKNTQETEEAYRVANEGASKFGGALNVLADKINKIGGVKPLEPPGVPAKPLASGGSIFKPKGTDTVPAMLTPGEFVVNSSAAKANKDILEKINNSNGTIYKAIGGGIINNTFTARKQRKEEADREQASYLLNNRAKLLYSQISPQEDLRVNQILKDYRDKQGTFGQIRNDGSIFNQDLTFPRQDNKLKETAQKERARTIKLRKQRKAQKVARANRINVPDFTGQSGRVGFSNRNDLFNYYARGVLPQGFRSPEQNQPMQPTIPSPTNIANATKVINRPPGLKPQDFLGAISTGIQNVFSSTPSEELDSLRSQFKKSKNPSILKKIGELERIKTSKRRQQFADGGLAIGTDTVPAMLTPGEFIVSAQAARANANLLNNINKGNVTYRQTGGSVGTGTPTAKAESNLYGADTFSDAVDRMINPLSSFDNAVGTLSIFSRSFAELVGPLNLFSQNIQSLPAAINTFNTASVNLSVGFGMFGQSAPELTRALDNLSNIPRTISIEGRTQVNVVHTGLEALNTIKADQVEEIKQAIIATLKPQIISDLKSGNVLG